MTEAEQMLPEDWRPHLGVVRDGISLRVQDEHFPLIGFLCEDGDAHHAVDVTSLAQQGRPFAEVEATARDLLIGWRDAHRRAAENGQSATPH